MKRELKIHAPAVGVRDVKLLAAAGARSFYIGFLDGGDDKPGSNLSALNRRTMGFANIRGKRELAKTIEQAKRDGGEIHLCTNFFYTDAEIEAILKDIAFAAQAGIDGLIIGDLGLIDEVRRRHPRLKLTASTVAATMSAADARFYQRIGLDAITLIRQLKLDEMRRIIAGAPELEYSAFIYGSKCPNLDAYCSFTHGVVEAKRPLVRALLSRAGLRRIAEKAPKPEVLMVNMKKRYMQSDLGCSMLYKTESYDLDGRPAPKARKPNWEFAHNLECGLCVIADLVEAGVSSFKIVGREHPLQKRIERTELVRRVLDYIAAAPKLDRPKFHEFCRKITKARFGVACRRSDCYYPESFGEAE